MGERARESEALLLAARERTAVAEHRRVCALRQRSDFLRERGEHEVGGDVDVLTERDVIANCAAEKAVFMGQGRNIVAPLFIRQVTPLCQLCLGDGGIAGEAGESLCFGGLACLLVLSAPEMPRIGEPLRQYAEQRALAAGDGAGDSEQGSGGEV